MLTDDIDADGAAASIPIFLGDFDGQGHKITGLRLTESCSEYDLFSRVESGASVRNLTVEGEVIPAGTQTDVGGIVGQMVADITLRFSSGGLDELEQAFALMADGPAAPDTAQLRADIGALQAVVSTLETTVTRALEEHGAVGARPLRGGLHGLFAARLPVRRGQQHAERLAQRREPRADRSEQRDI